MDKINTISTTYDAVEKPDLINPEREDPESLLNFREDGFIDSSDSRCKYTISTCCKIDRPSLNDARKKIWDDFVKDLRSEILEGATREEILGNVSEAEEVMQEAFIRVWKHASRWDPARKTRFTTWFYRVVTNLCYDVGRKRKPQDNVEMLETVASDDMSAENVIEVNQRSEQVQEALDALPQRQKMAIILCYFEGLSNREASDVMEVSLNALESYLVRARRNLADILKDDKASLLKEIG